ncbi:MAG: TetR family transcriptional regulator, partial [Ilumatobacteraceae bacterium]
MIEVKRRARTARAVANDGRILDAATALIVTRGVDSFGLRDVAVASGLTYGALYGRYEKAPELLVDLWIHRLGAEIERLVTLSAAAVSSASMTPEDRQWLTEPSGDLLAAMQLCIVSTRVEELADVVPREVKAWFARAAASDVPGGDPMRLGIAALLFGAVIVTPVHGCGQRHISGALGWIHAGVGRRAITGPAPAPTPAQDYDFATDDAALDALLHAAVDVVARSGLQRATLKRIGRVAGYSPSVPYAFYENREAMLFDVVSRCVEHTRGPEHPVYVGHPEISVASVMSGWSLPESRRYRRLSLEFLMAAYHDKRLAHVIDDADRMALGGAAAAINPEPSVQHAVITVLEASRDIAIGLALLGDLLDVTVADWRPFTTAFVDGLAQ